MCFLFHSLYAILKSISNSLEVAELEQRRRPMPVGIDDFKKLREEGYYFVDKTRFIKDFLDGHSNVTLITRPRRFGKTLTLSMLQYFFTMVKAEENRALFHGLDIETSGERYMREQGTRPVLFLTLKDAHSNTFSSMMIKVSELLRQLYSRFSYLSESGSLSVQDREYFMSILQGTCTAENMQFSLSNLIQFLEKHHHRQPILLLDEYDAPILSAWEKGYYSECVDFMRGFLGIALKTNLSLDFAVLTGVARISKESIFSGLNNLDVCSVLSDTYSDAMGFTQEEAVKLMADCGVEDKLTDLKRWYDGYRFGKKDIYNPWSVINFVRHGCEFRPYWLNTSGNAILHELLERVDSRRKRELEGLLQGKSVNAPVMENIVYSDIRNSRDALFMMLMTTGYLKPVEIWKESDYTEWAKLEIPNAEVRMAYRKEILGSIVPSQGESLLRDMLHSMTSGDLDGFSENLSALLQDFVSYHDAAQPESFYHGFILGLSVLMSGSYRVESNRESGYGRFDIAFFPLQPSNPGVILELKAAKSEDELEAKAREALSQIEDKAYGAELSKQVVKEIWTYGISFCGKKVWMDMGQEKQ